MPFKEVDIPSTLVIAPSISLYVSFAKAVAGMLIVETAKVKGITNLANLGR